MRAAVGVGRSATSGCGDRSAARAEFPRVAALAREVALPTFLARAALSLSSGSAGFEVDMFDREQIDLLWEAHVALPEEEAVLRALVAARVSIVLTMMDPEGQRGALAREAITLARAAADDRAIVQALAALCDVQAGPDHASDRLRYADEMLQRATTLGDWSLELLARRFLLVANLELGDLDAADDQALAFRLRAARTRHPLYEWYGPLWKAMRATARRAVLRGGRGQRRGGRDRRTGGQHERRPALRHPALVPARRDR